MATVDLEGLLDEWAVAWSSGVSSDPERVLDLYVGNLIFEDATLGMILHGKKELRSFVDEGFAAIPDFNYQVRNRFASDRWAVVEWTMSGTHRGDFPGMPATGRPFSLVRGTTVLELEAGRIRRESDLWNAAAFMQQVGLLGAA
jgi:steroid delta-isomerase-like uncharacterized protein